MKAFITRHKKKFIITGIIIGGTAITFRYLKRKINEIQERQTREFMEKTKRLNHFESTERTCNQLIIGLNNNLCSEIIRLLDTNRILEELRNSPENKIELWEKLKIICFTRLTTLVYAISMLVVGLRVQLNIMGAYLYKDTISEEEKISENVRHSYLSLIQYFPSEGIQKLEEFVKKKVVEVLKFYPLNEKVNLSDIEQIFWSIQMSINNDQGDPNSKISSYILPSRINGADLLQKMFNETLDVLETDDVSTLCSNNVSRGFSIVVDNIADCYSEAIKPTEVVKGSGSKTELNDVDKKQGVALHLAKVIPIINSITSKTFDSKAKPSSLVTSLVTFFMTSEKIKTLGANVYEVFSV